MLLAVDCPLPPRSSLLADPRAWCLTTDSIDITFVQTVTLRHATPSAFDEMLYPAATVSSSRLVKGLDTIWGKDHAGGFTRVQDYR